MQVTFMSEKTQATKEQGKQLASKSPEFDAQENLVGFFDLLLQIDKRNNPHLYARHSDSDNF